jgi:rubrerythrin
MATQSLDFSRLTLRDALDVAILVEEEARERYEEFADQLEIHHTPEAARFFRSMSRKEARREAVLRRRRELLFHGDPAAVSRAQLCDVKAPDYDEVRAFMTTREAMRTALDAEEKARTFFVAALPETRDPDAAALFDRLLRDEIQLQHRLRRELAALPADPRLDLQDFVDEPVEH